MRRLLFSVQEPTGDAPNGYRYYVDLRNGCFIYVFPEDKPPPEYWPLRELPAREVEQLMLGEEDVIS